MSGQGVPLQNTEQLFRQFKTSAGKVAAEVVRVATGVDAQQIILDYLRAIGAQKVFLAPSVLTAALALDEVLTAAGLVVIANSVAGAAEACVGITKADCALAATGTICQNMTTPGERLAASLPPVHLALLPTVNILASYADVFAFFNKKSWPGYLSFISGPSRTADIERVLTIGVHGPGRLIIICVDQEVGACV